MISYLLIYLTLFLLASACGWRAAKSAFAHGPKRRPLHFRSAEHFDNPNNLK
jgi:hypothetical protein